MNFRQTYKDSSNVSKLTITRISRTHEAMYFHNCSRRVGGVRVFKFVALTKIMVGAKSHGLAALPCRARSAAPYLFSIKKRYNSASFKLHVSHIIYSTVVSKTEK